MKLAHYTLRNASIVLAVVLTFWAYFFYLQIIHELTEETDYSLKNYKTIIIQAALTSKIKLNNRAGILTKYHIKEVSQKQATAKKDIFFDSQMYLEDGKRYEPVRVLITNFKCTNGKFYQLTIKTSTVERDQLKTAILWCVIILYIVLLCSILAMTNLVFRKSLRPLYNLLDWLKSYHLGKDISLTNETNIDEFRILTNTINAVSKQSRELFIKQKQFVENAAHELQTPLAICITKLELMCENPALTEEQLTEISELHHLLGRVVKLNKSLLLLSKIENNQFPETQTIELNPIIKQIVSDYSELYEYKQIKTDIREKGKLIFTINESLLSTLITNLIKNSFVHNYTHGSIIIIITPHDITISNTGEKRQSLDQEALFSRFGLHSEKKESNGLGLAIVKSIASIYSIQISYQYNDLHQFKLTFP